MLNHELLLKGYQMMEFKFIGITYKSNYLKLNRCIGISPLNFHHYLEVEHLSNNSFVDEVLKSQTKRLIKRELILATHILPISKDRGSTGSFTLKLIKSNNFPLNPLGVHYSQSRSGTYLCKLKRLLS